MPICISSLLLSSAETTDVFVTLFECVSVQSSGTAVHSVMVAAMDQELPTVATKNA